MEIVKTKYIPSDIIRTAFAYKEQSLQETNPAATITAFSVTPIAVSVGLVCLIQSEPKLWTSLWLIDNLCEHKHYTW